MVLEKGFPYISLCKTSDPRGGANFDSREIIGTNFVEEYNIMPHTKYQSSRLCGYGEEDWS